MTKLTHGTVQGSILGPVLFAIYIAPLEDLVNNIVIYADDNYQISNGKTEENALQECKTETLKMIT